MVSNLVHNVKWTLLSNLRYIVSQKDFNGFWEPKLTDENFADSTPSKLMGKPMFGVEFMGKPEGIEGLYEMAYRGPRSTIELNHTWALMSPASKLGFIHDSVILTLAEEERRQRVKLYDFTEESAVPTDTGKLLKLEFIESSFEIDEATGERREGINWVYSVTERPTAL